MIFCYWYLYKYWQETTLTATLHTAVCRATLHSTPKYGILIFELFNSMQLTISQVAECRMYEQRFPEIDEVVMVQVRERSDLVTLKFDVYAKVKSIAEMGAYVELLEYDNVEGMILLSELTRRRIRSVSKLIKVNRSEVLW